jgi:hypothetical protein
MSNWLKLKHLKKIDISGTQWKPSTITKVSLVPSLTYIKCSVEEYFNGF